MPSPDIKSLQRFHMGTFYNIGISIISDKSLNFLAFDILHGRDVHISLMNTPIKSNKHQGLPNDNVKKMFEFCHHTFIQKFHSRYNS